MRKTIIAAAAAALLLGFSFPGHASETVMGTIVKVEKEFVTVKNDRDGKEVRVHFDKRTEMDGKLKQGAMVEVEVDNGHAEYIAVLEEEGEESGEMSEF